MRTRFSHTPPSFALAFTLAPVAGAVAAFVATALWSGSGAGEEWEVRSALILSALSSLIALFISGVYTAIVGTLVRLYVLSAHRTPSWPAAAMVGVVLGVVPFSLGAIIEWPRVTGDMLLVPIAAVAASLATSCAFWFLGLKGRDSAA